VNPAGIAEIVLLAIGMAAIWLAAFGLLRLPDALTRLHCVGFAAAAGGFCFTAAILVDRGGSPLGFKSLFAALVTLAAGAVATQAVGRAVRLRRQSAERSR
jgi:multicomponent Na+:H+ antiporter subunit G